MADLDETPYLYVLMRSDMDSLNAGKGMAQAAHAANQCVFYIKNTRLPIPSADAPIIHDRLFEVRSQLARWQESRGFGVSITLDIGDERTMRAAVELATRIGLVADVVLDPSYPVRDGKVTHLIPVHTCGYVFGPKVLCQMILENFKLYA